MDIVSTYVLMALLPTKAKAFAPNVIVLVLLVMEVNQMNVTLVILASTLDKIPVSPNALKALLPTKSFALNVIGNVLLVQQALNAPLVLLNSS
jgi:hypothetical protein